MSETTTIDNLRTEIEVEREAGRIAREKAIHQHQANRELRARLARVVAWANARLSLDGFEPQDTPFHMNITHQVAWEALEPGDLDPVGQADPAATGPRGEAG